MLRFAEEILLLLLRDDDGKLIHVPERTLDRVIAGSVLMDLAMANRMYTDLEKLMLIDSTPIGDGLLDPTLAHVAAQQAESDSRYWVEFVASRAEGIREEAFARLVDRGILERKDDRHLWVFRSRRYPMVDGKAETYGQSITDACISFDDTVPVLEKLAAAVSARRKA